MNRYMSLGCIGVCALIFVLMLGGVTVASGKVLYETDFSGEESDYVDDWSGLETSYWEIEDGVLSVHQVRYEEDWRPFVFLTDGFDWIDYRVEFELEITGVRAGWMFRFADRSDNYFFQLTTREDIDGQQNRLRPHKTIWGTMDLSMANSRSALSSTIGEWIVPDTVYEITIEVEGDTIKHYINGELADEWTDSTHGWGTFGFRSYGAPAEAFKVYSLKITEL